MQDYSVSIPAVIKFGGDASSALADFSIKQYFIG